MAVLRSDVGPRQMLADLLGVQDVRSVRYMFVLGGLELRRLVHFLRRFEASSDTQIRGAMVCCFATFLFVTGDIVVDASVLYASRQALGGRLIIPMVLAETLNGEDAVAAVGGFFQGAPILLYMWPFERFRFFSGNQIPPGVMQDLGQFFQHPITYAFTRSTTGWTWVLSESSGYIRCRVPWWQLRSAVRTRYLDSPFSSRKERVFCF